MPHRIPPNAKEGEVRFIHLRYKDMYEDGSWEYSNRGGLTIAYRAVDDGVLEVAFARCNRKDNFCRKIGRAIAKGHLDFGYCYPVEIKNKLKLFDEVVNFALKKVREANVNHGDAVAIEAH